MTGAEVTSWNGGDEPDDLDDEGDDFRSHIDAAEPPPVTDAMITPRTSPTAELPSTPTTGVVCHVCDEQNQPGASYCLACGVSLTQPSTAEPLPWIDDDEPEFDAGAGLLDLGEMDEVETKGDDVSKTESTDQPQTAPSLLAKITGRHILVGVVTIAVLGLLYTTYVEPDSQTATTSVTTIPTEPNALDSYTTSIGALAATVADLQNDAAAINRDWEDRVIDYQTTLTSLSGLDSRAAALPDLIADLSAPDEIGDATHQRLVTSVGTIASAATEMVEGLEAPDTGEARRAALSKFDAASTEFASLARVVDQSAASITTTTIGG